MNKDLQDKYIFDFLDGNLSEKEEALFHDLINDDITFRNEYLGWKDTYFNTTTPIVTFNKKAGLKKKSNIPKTIIISSVILFLIGGVTFVGIKQSESVDKEKTRPPSVVQQQNNTMYDNNNEKYIEIVSLAKPQNNKSPQNRKTTSRKDISIIPIETALEKQLVDNINPQSTIDTVPLVTNTVKQEPLDSIQQKSIASIPEEKNDVVILAKHKPSRLAKKILRKEKRSNQKNEIPTWEQLKEAFKNPKVIPVN